MSEFSDLPDNVRKAIEDLLDTLSGMTPEQIFQMLSDVLGDTGIAEFRDLINANEEFQIKIDHDNFDLDEFIDELDDFYMDQFEQSIEPYYEIAHIENDTGQIIVEMPGLTDNDMIDWYEYEDEIFIHTIDSVENYKLTIPLPTYYRINEEQIIYRNGLLIMPFIIE